MYHNLLHNYYRNMNKYCETSNSASFLTRMQEIAEAIIYIPRSYLRHSPIFLVTVSRLSRFSRFSRHRVLKQRTTLANNYFAFYYPPREGSSYRITSVTLASVHSFIWLASKENGSFVLTSSFSVILTINRHAKYVTDLIHKNKR